MISSPARIAANRRNARKSTGPKTPEGKERSRLNAARHGLTGSPDILNPAADAARVAKLTATFAAELGAPGATGHLLARRAAILAERMDRAALHDRAAVAANAAAARVEFDGDRLDAVDALIAEAESVAGDLDANPDAALRALEASPEGLDYLGTTWGELLDLLRATEGADDATRRAAGYLAARWLGLPESAARAELAARAGAEVERLRRLDAATRPALLRALEAGREQAGHLGGFDPGLDASTARKYEAAAERGFYRALRAIRDLRRDQAAPAPTASLAPPAPTPDPERQSGSPPTAAPLASFRSAASALAVEPCEVDRVAFPLDLPGSRVPVAASSTPVAATETPRRPRPDLRKLAGARR